MRSRALLFTAATICGLVAASAAHAQLTLRGDYAAARGITELSALYAREHKTNVVVTPFSTNSGIQGVLEGSIDVAASARPPIPSRPAEKELVFWPVAWDAVVFIVHPSNPVSELSVSQVRDIFNGKLRNWTEVGGKNAPIDLYSVMGPYDGLETSVRQILFGNPGYNARISRLFLNQHQIEVGIQMDPDAIGMTTLAGLNQQRVKALRIEGQIADAQTVADGRYLLTLPLFMVYRADNPKAAEIERFAQFLRTPVAESVIVNKRLALHRENDEAFGAMHAQRLARLWEGLGGEPVASGMVRFAGNSNGNGSTVEAEAGAQTIADTGETDSAPAATAVANTAADAGASPATAGVANAGAGGAAVAVTTADVQAANAAAPAAEESAAPDADATTVAARIDANADAPEAAAGGNVDEGDCRKRLFSRKC